MSLALLKCMTGSILVMLCLGGSQVLAQTEKAETETKADTKFGLDNKVQEPVYNSVDEFGESKAREQENAELLKKSFIPDGCRLKSHLQNGTMGHFVCEGKDVFTGVVLPENGLSEDLILTNTTKTPGCASEIKESPIGKYVSCQTPTHDVMQNYVRVNNSGLLLTAVVPDGLDVGMVAAMENYTLEIYFYVRGIAVSEERIKIIKEELAKSQECVESNCLWQ